MRIAAIVGGLMLIVTSLAEAKENDVTWNGYINLVGGILQNNRVSDTSANTQHPGYYSYENRFTAMEDSLIALQAKKVIDDKFSVTGQIMSRGRTDSFQSSLNWAYVTYNITDLSTLRCGRLGLPVYYYSDFVDVGLAYHWVAPPRETYPVLPAFQGANYLRYDSISNIDFTTEIFGGAFDQKDAIPGGRGEVTSQGRDVMGAALTVGPVGWLTGRLMYMTGSGNSNIDINLGAIANNPVVAADINKILNTGFSKEEYYNAFIRADFEHWFLMSEGIVANGGGLLNLKVRRWYISSGMRFNKVTYHVTFAKSEDTFADVAVHFSNALTRAVAPILADSFANNNTSWTVGARIDTSRTTAVKVELYQYEEFASGRGETAGIGKNALLRVAFNASF